ncbi:hypothetical protein, partial [Vibrio harveyi]|uniref:hypothetical protein n=2 Tax=Vibrio harveyi TaxID=669 RepID=UPI001B807E25
RNPVSGLGFVVFEQDNFPAECASPARHLCSFATYLEQHPLDWADILRVQCLQHSELCGIKVLFLFYHWLFSKP